MKKRFSFKPLHAALAAVALFSAASAVAASYQIPVTAAGDVVWRRNWYYGGADNWSEVAADPNAVYHEYEPGWGNTAFTRLTFDLTPLLPVAPADIQSASFNFDVLKVWTIDGRDNIGTFSAGGTVYFSGGTGWKSFDITDSLRTALGNGQSSVQYELNYTGYSGFEFGSAEGGKPAYLLVTAVPEPEAWAMMLAGLGLMGAALRRRKSARP